MSLRLNIRRVGEISVIDVSGRLTLGQGSGAIREEVQELLVGGNLKILINLAEVSYIDSSGIGELVADFTSVTNAGGALKLVGLSKGIKELLRVTKLNNIFEVHEDEDLALSSFVS
jgi:anti-sigma B factor antagonist